MIVAGSHAAPMHSVTAQRFVGALDVRRHVPKIIAPVARADGRAQWRAIDVDFALSMSKAWM